jgi:hypothetical protein
MRGGEFEGYLPALPGGKAGTSIESNHHDFSRSIVNGKAGGGEPQAPQTSSHKQSRLAFPEMSRTTAAYCGNTPTECQRPKTIWSTIGVSKNHGFGFHC